MPVLLAGSVLTHLSSCSFTQEQPRVEQLEDLIPITAPTCPAMVWIQPGLVQGGSGGKSQNHSGWKSPLRSSTPTINLAEPSTTCQGAGWLLATPLHTFSSQQWGAGPPLMWGWICSLPALWSCQHRCHSQVTSELAGQWQCWVTPELLTWHLQQAVAFRVISGDQGTEEMAGAVRLLWVFSQWPTFLCTQKPLL